MFTKGNKAAKGYGRPRKDWTVASMIRQAMESNIDIVKNGKIKKEKAKLAVYNKLIEMAAEGDVSAAKEINNRLAGLPVQPIDQTVKGGLTIRKISYLDADVKDDQDEEEE